MPSGREVISLALMDSVFKLLRPSNRSSCKLVNLLSPIFSSSRLLRPSNKSRCKDLLPLSFALAPFSFSTFKLLRSLNMSP